MKTKIFSLILLLGAALTSCTDNWEPNTGDKSGIGGLAKFSLNIANGEKPVVSVPSRAGDNLNDYIIVANDAQGKELGRWTYGSMPEIIDLPVGTGYTVTAMSHQQADQAWEAPYYEGKSDAFNIVNGETTQISSITCRFSNIAVTVTFSNEMKALMGPDCKVTVVANANGMLEFTADETRTGHFRAIPDSPTLVATLTGTLDGQPVEVAKPYTDVVAGNHYYINYSVQGPNIVVPDETGSIFVDPATGISINFNVDDVAQNGNVDTEEESGDASDRPGHEDPKPGDNPGGGEDPGQNPGGETPAELFSFVCPNIDFTKVNDIVLADPPTEYKVTITSVNPVADLQVRIDSPSLVKDDLEGMGLSDQFSLAYPGDYEEGLNNLGFDTGSKIIGKHEVVFDITTFVPLIPVVSQPGQVHNFIITVTDDKGQKGTCTISFRS